MSVSPYRPFGLALALSVASVSPGFAAPPPVAPPVQAGRQPADLAGTWDLAVDKGGETCRVLLRSQKADKGDYLIGLPAACRHSMPELAKVGGWTLSDGSHLALNDTAGGPVLVLATVGSGFSGSLGTRVYTMKAVGMTGRSATGFAPVDTAAPGFAEIVPVASRRKVQAAVAAETPSEIGGRYAVMREKRDTGCMVTLDDKSHVKGGARAQLAPGCRDQGIVIFDPTAWQMVKGELVLTARAGHKAHLQKAGEGSWSKDPKEGGKPLGLKKL